MWITKNKIQIYEENQGFQREKVIPNLFHSRSGDKIGDNVDNYYFRSDSPIFTTFPAPIVINKSLGTQFSLINFSMLSNVSR